MTARHLPPADVLADSIAAGHTLTCVAQQYGVSAPTIKRRLHAAGLPTPGSGSPCCGTTSTPTPAAPVTTGTHLTGNRWPTWYADAICAQTDPEEFFPHVGQATRAAKALCATCPARDACLAFAVANPTLTGIWGGTTDRQRRRMRRGST